jgi:hypothetical protein
MRGECTNGAERREGESAIADAVIGSISRTRTLLLAVEVSLPADLVPIRVLPGFSTCLQGWQVRTPLEEVDEAFGYLVA